MLTKRFKRIESVEAIVNIKKMREEGMTIPQIKEKLKVKEINNECDKVIEKN